MSNITNNEAKDPLIGRSLGDFLVEQKLGEGGFGAVYKATQITLSRPAVIKVLHTKHRENQNVLERFKREAYLASRLEHPYMAHIYSFGAETDGLLWIAMEMVAGTPLDSWLKVNGAMPLARFVPLFDKICEVIFTAHEAGIIHRDIKPANIMVISRAGRLLPKLLDFGIAKGLSVQNEASSSINISEIKTRLEKTINTEAVTAIIGDTAINEQKIAIQEKSITDEELRASREKNEEAKTVGVMGSPIYMAPEQWEAAIKADARSDIYALGVSAYELLTGEVPFKDQGYALMYAHLAKPVPTLGVAFPEKLHSVISKAMAKEAKDRYQTALEFAQDLREASGLNEQQYNLPQLDSLLVAEILNDAPQPIAESVANLNAAKNAFQLRDSVLTVFRTLVRYIGLLALASRSSIKLAKKESESLMDIVKKLRSSGLNESEWIKFVQDLCRPFASQKDVHPIPELVGLFFSDNSEQQQKLSTSLSSLLHLEQYRNVATKEEQLVKDLEPVLAHLSSILRSVNFLNHYLLVIPTSHPNKTFSQSGEKWMGLARNNRASISLKGKVFAEEPPILTDVEGNIVISLWPLVQVASPSPGQEKELFLLERRGRHGAKLVSFPAGFEHEDESPWQWLKEQFFAEEEKESGSLAEEKLPYPGLSTFKSEDASLFYGREKETESLLNRLKIQPFLAIVGPSGAGKSSFVQAGIIPNLGENWLTITVRPGASPLANLSAKLVKEGIEIPKLDVNPRAKHGVLGNALRSKAQADNKPILLIIDQFEELFTLCLDQQERELYGEYLVKAARSEEEPIRIIITLRDDFLIRAKSLSSLREQITQNLELLTTPQPEDLLRILTEPAKRQGYHFEDEELPREIVESVKKESSALPLLAFTAAKLWELRDRQFKQLRRKTYEAMGGIGGSLAQHAESVMSELSQEEQKLVREAFRHLVTSEVTRSIITRVDLRQLLGNDREADLVIEKLVTARLLVASEGEGGIETIEVIHEALLSAWPRLVKWRQETVEGARLRDQLRVAAKQWQERDRAKGLLWRDEALIEYKLWRSHYPGNLTDVEEAFGTTSISEATRAQRNRRTLGSIAIVILISGLVVLFFQRQQAVNSANEARNLLLESYEEQGRQEMINGNPLKSLVYLSEVYSKGKDSTSLRLMLAQSMRSIDSQWLFIQGHKDVINSVTFSSDGKQVLTASDDRTAKVWDSTTGKQLVSLEGHKDSVSTAFYSKDDKRILTSSLDKTAKIWDASTGKMLFSIGDNTDIIYCASFNPDNSKIVTASRDKTAKIWDASTGSLILSLEGHTSEVITAKFSPDSKYIVTSSFDKTAKIWDAVTGKLIYSLDGHKDGIRSAEFSPDGKQVVTASFDKTAKLWDATTGNLLHTLEGHVDVLHNANFNSDGTQVITASGDKTAKVWDTKSGNLVFTIKGHTADVVFANFNPTNTNAVTASVDRTVKIWDAKSNNIVLSIGESSNALRSASFSSNGKKIVTSSTDKIARIWDSTTGNLLVSLIGHTNIVTSATFSPDSKRIVTASSDRLAKIWDAETGGLIFTLSGHKDALRCASFSPDGKYILTISRDDNAKLWDATSGNEIRTIETQYELRWGAFSPDGKQITTVNGKITKVWDIETGKLVLSLPGHLDQVNSAVFSPDNRFLLTASADKTAKVWDAITGKLICSLEGHIGVLNFASFSPNGKYIVTASADKTAKVWDGSNGKFLASLEGHIDGVSSASFSPNSKQIVSASKDGTTKVWDVHLETRTPVEIDTIVKKRVPFRLEQGRLVPINLNDQTQP